MRGFDRASPSAVIALLCLASSAQAHQGPPFPILVDKSTGPFVVSVWADPNVGIGKFYVMLDPRPGGAVPPDTTVEIAVQPVSRRLKEAVYDARRDDAGRVEFYAEIPFDQEEKWHVRFHLHSSRGDGDAATDVDVTPPGPGPYDWVLYAAPFAFLGGFWIRGLLKEKSRANAGRRG